MTTPNRPPLPDWYQQNPQVPKHIGPTQRDLISRRIRSLRKFLLGTSLVGVATFTTLAAYHTQSKASATAEQTAPAGVAQQSSSTAQAPASSLFSSEETRGFTAESEGSDDGVAQVPAATTAPAATQPAATATSGAQSTTVLPTTPQITAPQTMSRHHTRTVSS